MQFVAKDLPDDENVNVSHTPPLKEFIALLGALLLVGISTLVLLTVVTNLLLPFIPQKWEPTLFSGLSKVMTQEMSSADTYPRVATIFNELEKQSTACTIPLTLYISKDTSVNAFALPGGILVLNEGLLKKVTSENELSFVIAHEIAHIIHRDHLRSLGLGISLQIVNLLFMQGATDMGFLLGTLNGIGSSHYSQKQEKAADNFALYAVMKRYGHTGGATDLFGHIHETDLPKGLTYLFATHPSPDTRIETLKATMQKEGFSEQECVPFSLKKQK